MGLSIHLRIRRSQKCTMSFGEAPKN